MASELPPEQQASYSAIIDQILASSDLNTISAKRIRKGLQEKVDYDITPQKQPITDLIMERFDKFQRDGAAPTAVPEPAPTANGTANHVKSEIEATDVFPPTSPTKRKAPSSPSDDDSAELSDVVDSPPPKKAKKTKAAETDEEIARRMQAEMNAVGARSTRGGGSATKKKAAPKKNKTPKKKSKAKIGSDEDSEVEGEEKPEREKKGGFHKPMTLSAPLSALLDNEPALSRPQTVKRIWAYVKERDLQDPNDKRQIVCDEPMRAVFKQDKVHMFTMNKILATHLYAQDE